ncbi:KLF8 factor, partial [Odontophorus gujanensis]|nr:KLF8 factor [Odontophorus gujanensis]
PPEELLASDCSQPQAEPVDLSLNKSKAPPPPPPVQSSPLLVAPPVPAPTISIASSGLGTTSAIPAVLSPGSILASSQGSGGQQILHVIHTIPSVNLPSKMGNLQTIPVVVQSLPVVYTTMPTDGVTAITVPLIGGDGKNTGSVKMDPGAVYPMDVPSDSEDSASESGPAPFQDLQRE